MDFQPIPFLYADSRGAKISIKEQTLVRPQEEMPATRMWLSNLDLLHKPRHVPTMKFYKNSNGASNFFEPKLLKESLSKALVQFYPLAGRLTRDEKGRLEVNCNGEGALFVVAETDAAMADLGENLPPSEELEQLVPKVDSTGDISEYPLLLVQVTTFKCGGVCIGLGLHHNLADGTGAGKFIISWASITRGESVKFSPFLDRTILRARSPPMPKFHHTEHDPPPTLKNPNQSPSDCCIEVLEITSDQISKLKARASKCSSGHTINENYSTYEVLTAHIWRCATKARRLPYDQPTQLQMSTDGRSRLEPKLPQGYFGNVIIIAQSIVLSGELISEPFKKSVHRVRKAIKRIDNDYIRSGIDFLEQQENLTPLMLHEKRWQYPNLKIISWMRLPFYDIDFGWGMPFCMRTTSKSEGKGHILPKNPNDDGNLLLSICLETEHMQLFKKYFGLID